MTFNLLQNDVHKKRSERRKSEFTPEESHAMFHGTCVRVVL